MVAQQHLPLRRRLRQTNNPWFSLSNKKGSGHSAPLLIFLFLISEQTYLLCTAITRTSGYCPFQLSVT